jgi:translation initiation factor IF-1
MSDSHSVKARTHHGSESLDITIPAKIKREYEISSGDVFIVDVSEQDEKIKVTYERVYSSESSD